MRKSHRILPLLYEDVYMAPPVLFIHGAPGDWSAWGQYFADTDLNDNAFLLAFDRPGYGGSEKGKWEPDLKNQSDAFIQAAMKEHDGPFIAVGHSFGGPVAMQMAIDHHDKLDAMIILAGSIDPDLEKTKWFQYVADFPPVQWLVPSALNVANQEILPLKAELEKQQPSLKNVKTRIVVIQGKDDTLVPPGNADYAEEQLINADLTIIRIENRGHFLPWEEYDLVKTEILKLLPEGKNTCANMQ